MAARQVALDHYRDRRRLAQAVVVEAKRLWGRVDPARIRQSWLELVQRLVVVVTGAQLAAAMQAEAYLDEVLAAQGVAAAAEGALVASTLAGVASDGLPLDTLLVQPAIAAVTALDRGRSTREALAAGYSTLDMMVRTQVADAGRVADGVALTARPRASGYVRMVVGATCSRCIILAGRWYQWNAGFQRHPRCDCIAIPASEDTADDVQTDPKKTFESMTEAEQDRVFTKAGAQAIRDGADMGQVVNARRGMYTASIGPKKFLATREGSTVRGLFGGYEIDPDTGRLRRRGVGEFERRRSGSRFIRAARAPRLMPEQIYAEAGGDRDEAIRLLTRFGYITDRGTGRSPAQRPTFTARPRAVEREALGAVPAGLGRNDRTAPQLTRQQRDALRDYQSSFYFAINGQLRRGEVEPLVGRRVERLDQVMRASRLTRDVEVWRGMADARRLFGDRLDRDMTGLSWREDAYVSTSAKRGEARQFTYQGTAGVKVLMRIVAPRGMGAARLSGEDDQAEILLQRGARMRVVRDHGVSPQGYRLLDVVAAP